MQMEVVSIVSPYPFEEVNDAQMNDELLCSSSSWPEQAQEVQPKRDPRFHIDMGIVRDREVESDDFSVSTTEADSLEDLGESISTDPESFWDAPVCPPSEPEITYGEKPSQNNDIEKYPVPVIPTSTVLHLPELSC